MKLGLPLKRGISGSCGVSTVDDIVVTLQLGAGAMTKRIGQEAYATGFHRREVLKVVVLAVSLALARTLHTSVICAVDG